MYNNEYYCPHCGAVLNEQAGFDPNKDVWECEECGQLLYGDSIYEGEFYPGVMWYCDNCGALLNKQVGFSDTCGSWFCTECGFINSINENEVYSSREAYERSRTDNTNYFQSEEDESHEYDEEYEYDNPRRCENCGRLLNKQDDFDEWRGHHTCTVCGFDNYWDESDKDNDDLDEDDEPGYYYLPKENEQSESSVYSHSDNSSLTRGVNGGKKQGGNRKPIWILAALFFAVIVFMAIAEETHLFEHVFNKVQISVSAKDFKGMDFKEAQMIIKSDGFSNITLKKKEDVVLGLFAKEGEVESVTINGSSRFTAGDWFEQNSKIVITYHTKK